MQNDTVLQDILTGGASPFGGVVIPQTRSTAQILDRSEVLHRQVRDLHGDSADLRRASMVAELEDRQQRVASRTGLDLLEAVADAGMAWRDVARLLKVTVPAVQKWRRGEGMSGANRLRLAKVVAMLDMLNQYLVSEPVSWMEMPVKEGVALRRLDLLLGDRFDLALELVSDGDEPIVVDPILDEFDPTWRQSRVDTSFELFIAEDGIVSIRPHSE